MRNVLAYDPDKCTGCLYCENACIFRHHGVFSKIGPLIKIVTDEKGMFHMAMFCHHCKRPICVDLFPVNAITKDEETGLVHIKLWQTDSPRVGVSDQQNIKLDCFEKVASEQGYPPASLSRSLKPQ